MSLKNIFYFIVKSLFRIIFTIYNRLEVRGLGNIPGNTPLIVASNHASNVDPPLIGGVFPGRLRYLAKESLFQNPLLGFLIGVLGAVPVSRTDSQKAGAVMKLMLGLLTDGQSVLIFPEGSRSKDGRLKPLEGGAAFLSVKSGVPILPVYIRGSNRVHAPGKIFPRPAKLVITFSPPIFPDAENAGRAGERERRGALTMLLERELRALEAEGSHHD